MSVFGQMRGRIRDLMSEPRITKDRTFHYRKVDKSEFRDWYRELKAADHENLSRVLGDYLERFCASPNGKYFLVSERFLRMLLAVPPVGHGEELYHMLQQIALLGYDFTSREITVSCEDMIKLMSKGDLGNKFVQGLLEQGEIRDNCCIISDQAYKRLTVDCGYNILVKFGGSNPKR